MNIILLFSVVILSGCAIYFEPEFNLSEDVRIYQVVDGDTFIISSGQYVRLLGVDTPERGEEGYHEATDFLRKFEGQVVILESEGDDRDQFGRMLRHAFVNGTNIALSLLENDQAVVYEKYEGTRLSEYQAASR